MGSVETKMVLIGGEDRQRNDTDFVCSEEYRSGSIRVFGAAPRGRARWSM